MNRNDYARMFRALQRTRTRYAECAKIVRQDGTTYRFTSHDRPLRINEADGGVYSYTSANSFVMTSIETEIGLPVSNMDIDVMIDDDSITSADLQNNKFENARVELFIAYWSNRNIGTLPLRVSWMGELKLDGNKFRVELRGIAQRLAQVTVSSTSIECRWSFCDQNTTGKSFCGLDPVDYTSTFTITDVESADTFSVNIPDQNHGNYYQWGKATFLTGNNENISMEILRQYNDRVQLFLPMDRPIQVGDTVELLAGCDKTLTSCRGFNNARRFGGEPFIVGSDFLSRYPTPKTGADEED